MARILVVDDEILIREALRQVLEHAGYEVMDAPNGRVAMRLYDEKPADLVITDLIMPDQEGLETIMQLRRLSDRVKIIAISGGGRYGLSEFLDVAKKLGAQRTLNKPFNLQDILAIVNELLEEKAG